MLHGAAVLWAVGIGTVAMLPPAVLTDDTVTPTTTVASVTTTRGPGGQRGPLPGSVTCATVEQAGSAAAVPAASLRALQPQQASSCIALLGKDPLAEDQARAIWDVLLQGFDTADLVPDDTIRLLGWVSAGIPSDHLVNLSLSEIETVAALGAFHNLSLEQLTALAESVRFQWSAKEPEDLSDLDLAALKHILCGFNASDLVRVHAEAYKDAASSLSLLRCPGMPGAAPVPGVGVGLPGGTDAGGAGGESTALPSLRTLASLAQSGDAFGDPGAWSAGTVRAVGCVLLGLPPKAMSRVPTASLHTMLQSLAGGEQPILRHCLYGTPLIAQRLSSSDQQQQVFFSSTVGPGTGTGMGTRPDRNASATATASGPGPGPRPGGAASNSSGPGSGDRDRDRDLAKGRNATLQGRPPQGNKSLKNSFPDVLVMFLTALSISANM